MNNFVYTHSAATTAACADGDGALRPDYAAAVPPPATGPLAGLLRLTEAREWPVPPFQARESPLPHHPFLSAQPVLVKP